ncbi:MAG: hypothetical protein WD940_00320 [Patescibacteria group bacterium]
MRLAEFPRNKIALALAILIGGIFIALLIVIFGGRGFGTPAVASIEPAGGQENYLGEIPIAVTFQEDLTEEQQDLVYFEFQPEAFFTLRWTAANRVEARFVQPLALELDTNYSVKVLYNNEPIYTSSFKTPAITEEQLLQDLTEQTEGDELFAEAQTDWYKDNPWYSKLPIIEDDYTIVYEPDTKKFRIRITMEENTLGTQIGDAKDRAIKNLETIGVDLSQYSYYFIGDY